MTLEMQKETGKAVQSVLRSESSATLAYIRNINSK